MPKAIFISCGQYTPEEKQLGKQISKMVRTLTDCVPFCVLYWQLAALDAKHEVVAPTLGTGAGGGSRVDGPARCVEAGPVLPRGRS